MTFKYFGGLYKLGPHPHPPYLCIWPCDDMQLLHQFKCGSSKKFNSKGTHNYARLSCTGFSRSAVCSSDLVVAAWLPPLQSEVPPIRQPIHYIPGTMFAVPRKQTIIIIVPNSQLLEPSYIERAISIGIMQTQLPLFTTAIYTSQGEYCS